MRSCLWYTGLSLGSVGVALQIAGICIPVGTGLMVGAGLAVGACGFVSKTLYHDFVVFETERAAFSMSKGFNAITIRLAHQDHKEKLLEKNECDGHSKKDKTSLVDTDLTIRDVVTWLDDSKERENEYHIIWRNCQDFADIVFREFAQTN